MMKRTLSNFPMNSASLSKRAKLRNASSYKYFSSDSKTTEITDKENKENARWAMGFFGVILFANFFTVWQEWDALTNGGDSSKSSTITNAGETVDVAADDDKVRRPKYSY